MQTLQETGFIERYKDYVLTPDSNVLDVYQIIKDKWKKRDDSLKQKEAMALIITPENRIEFFDLSNTISKDLKSPLFQFNSRQILEEARRRNGSEIVLVENTSTSNIDDVESLDKQIAQFKKKAEYYNLKLKDYLVVLPFGFYSYTSNQL